MPSLVQFQQTFCECYNVAIVVLVKTTLVGNLLNNITQLYIHVNYISKIINKATIKEYNNNNNNNSYYYIFVDKIYNLYNSNDWF